MKRLLFGLIGVCAVLGVCLLPVSAQGNYAAQIQSAIRRLLSTNQTITGTWTFSTPPVGGGAPTNATYITQTANSSLSAEQALGALATGLMFSTTTTGIITTIAPTDDNLVVGSGTTWALKALSSCSAGSSALTYNTTTNAFGCNTISTTITIADTQVAFATAANTIGGDAGLTYNSTTHTLTSLVSASNNNFKLNNSGYASGAAPVNIVFDNSGALTIATFNGANLVLDDAGDATVNIGAANHLSLVGGAWTIASDGSVSALGGNLTIDAIGSLATVGSVTATNVILSDGTALQTDTTDAHTACFGAVYDVNGTAYVCGILGTNGNTPTLDISAPTGGTMTIQPTTYKSSDGTSGLTQTCAAAVVALTIKNGLITAVSCP